MSRRRLGIQEPRPTDGNLVSRLADELKAQRQTGQPMIYEQMFPGERMRVTVVWDAWDSLSLEERTAIILEAYSEAEGTESRAKVALASGLTIPEAESAGMLPFNVITALREDDPVTVEQCREAMTQLGASVLLDPALPQLRFATQEEAQEAVAELVKLLPGSAPVWVITKDVGKVDDWLHR